MTFGSLFSGIGGLDLGLERAGIECRWQVEIDPFCQRVLAKHWPEVKRYGDIRELSGEELERVDLIAGGFPCQDVSDAGQRAGINGSRSGLWSEYIRLIRLLRPRFVLVENVPGLLARGMGRVLGDLAASGYGAEWDCIPAEAVGAPHLRYRVFIVAYSESPERGQDSPEGRDLEREGCVQARRQEGASGARVGGASVAHSSICRVEGERVSAEGEVQVADSYGSGAALADADSGHRYGRSGDVQMGRRWFTGEVTGDGLSGRDEWRAEPELGRVAHGVPNRVDRLRGLGNAVVPQVAEWIGRQILASEAA